MYIEYIKNKKKFQLIIKYSRYTVHMLYKRESGLFKITFISTVGINLKFEI